MGRFLCVFLCVSVMAVALCVIAYCKQPPVETVAEPTTVTMVTETTEVTIESTTATEPTEVIQEITLYDVPLDAELQRYIIDSAEANGIDPAIIMAMARKESTYRAEAVGDGGNSLGLLQIQPRWHKARMKKLGCTDLLDPYQNVTVAVDYLCELLNKHGSIDKALTAYNQGHYNGTVTKYAKTVLAYAKQINKERSQ